MSRISSRRRSARATAVVASVAALVMLVPLSASAETLGPIVQVSTFSPATGFTSCGDTSIATNADSGVTLAAWAGTQGGPAVSAPLHVATIGADAAPGPTATYQPADAMPLGLPGDCNPLAVDAGANGGFIVTWSDALTDGAIYGILVDSAGAFIGSSFAVSSHSTYSDIETTSAAWSAAESRYLVTWKASVDTPFPAVLAPQQIVGRFIDAAGVPIGADFLVTDIAQQINNSQEVAYGGGTWLVVGTGDLDSVMRAVRVAADGTVDAPILVPSPAGSANGAAVEFNAATGQFLIAGMAAGDSWGQLVLPSGVLVGAPFYIDTVLASGKPRVESLGAAGWLIAWHTSTGMGSEIYVVKLDTAGVPLGAPQAMSSGIADTAVELNFRPEVAFSATTGQAYVFWSRYLVADNATNVVIRAWGDAIINPSLASTGVDAESGAALAGIGALTVLAGVIAVTVAVRRRRSFGGRLSA